MTVRTAFSHFARAVANAIGTPYAFMIALGLVVAWACLGPVFNYSQQWQLIINTGTTIATFLVVFLIQTTQNRDAKAVHLKLDELLHSLSRAQSTDRRRGPDRGRARRARAGISQAPPGSPYTDVQPPQRE